MRNVAMVKPKTIASSSVGATGVTRSALRRVITSVSHGSIKATWTESSTVIPSEPSAVSTSARSQPTNSPRVESNSRQPGEERCERQQQAAGDAQDGERADRRGQVDVRDQPSPARRRALSNETTAFSVAVCFRATRPRSDVAMPVSTPWSRWGRSARDRARRGSRRRLRTGRRARCRRRACARRASCAPRWSIRCRP